MLLTSKYPEHTVCASVSIFTVSSETTISGFSYSNIPLDSKFIFSFNFFTCNFMLDYHSFYHRPEAAAFRQRAGKVSRLRAADTFCLIARLVLHCPAGLDFALRAQSRASLRCSSAKRYPSASSRYLFVPSRPAHCYREHYTTKVLVGARFMCGKQVRLPICPTSP